METLVKKLIEQLRTLLKNRDEMDLDQLRYEAESLCRIYDAKSERLMNEGVFDWNGDKEFTGLNTKFERLYGECKAYDRDPRSLLAQKIDIIGLGFNDEIIKVEGEVLVAIQRTITLFIADRARKDTLEDDCEFAKILIKNKPVMQIEENKVMRIASYLQDITNSFTEYIRYYRQEGWSWSVDLIFLSQYIFEHIIEATYKISYDDSESLSFDIKDAFSYYEPDVPDSLKTASNEATPLLEDILYDIISFVETKGYERLDYESWFRPILYNIGILGMKYTLEQESIKS